MDTCMVDITDIEASEGDVVTIFGGGPGNGVEDINFTLHKGEILGFAGLLGFVGLVTPHMLRRFTGDEARLLLPASALGGAALLLLCDTASRLVFAPYELPVGITLALIGGPFFIWLLLRQRRVRRHD